MAMPIVLRWGAILVMVAALAGFQRPAADEQGVAYPSLETAQSLLANTYLDDEMPGTTIYGIEPEEPTWDNVL